jgi:predicted dehydrogenase
VVEIQGGEPGTARSWRSEETVSYASGFKQELIAFHEAVVTGQPPETTGLDGLRDIALCQAIIECHRRRAPVAQPTAVGT